jgi:hypothetical protein
LSLLSKILFEARLLLKKERRDEEEKRRRRTSVKERYIYIYAA